MEEIGIGTTLYLYEESYRPRGDRTPEGERRCYRPKVIAGETRGKWLAAAGDGGEYEINKRTLLMSGVRDRLYGPRQFYTAAQVEDRIWEDVHRPALLRLVDRADATTLRKVAAAVGYEPGKPTDRL